MIGHVQLSLLIMGGPTDWLFSYLSAFAGNWLNGVHMYQNDTCEIISQSDHPFNSYDKKSWGLLGSVRKS